MIFNRDDYDQEMYYDFKVTYNFALKTVTTVSTVPLVFLNGYLVENDKSIIEK